MPEILEFLSKRLKFKYLPIMLMKTKKYKLDVFWKPFEEI